MSRIALLTPWPPQASGIADYAYDLAKVLSRQATDLAVYTTEKSPRELRGVDIHTVNDSSCFKDLNDFDTLVYQLGNNTSFHLWMIPLLNSHPGIIHVHDLVMHHMVAWQTWLEGDSGGYLEVMERWHGSSGREKAEEALRLENYLWDSDEIGDYPLSEEYLQEARGILVHSQHALAHIRRTTPHVPSFQIPQLYDLQKIKEPAARLRNIVILGGVDPQKRVDWALDALADIKDRIEPGEKLTLKIAGSIDPRCSSLEQRASDLDGATLEIDFLGRVTDNQFEQLFLEADLCIALRYPTMGETSAIVSRAMQYGVPTVVNDIGWYAELPGNIVKKLPVANCQRQLGNLLTYLINDEQAYRQWGQDCRSFAEIEFSLEDYGRHYLDICTNPRGEEMVADIVSEVFRDCGMRGSEEEDAVLYKILDESYF